MAAGGWSGRAIKRAVVGLLATLPEPGSMLDYGAGTGELLAMLRSHCGSARMVGADYLPKPASLSDDVEWVRGDLNYRLATDETFDVVVSTEVIEHLENPRHTFREFHRLLKPGGHLVLTCPNQESLRSYLSLMIGGHFADFLGPSYPAHITALVRADFTRIAQETGFSAPRFSYVSEGRIPKLPRLTWQRISAGTARGRLFSDTLMLVARRH